jgi:hypothetical protein
VDVVAIVALARNVEEEAPTLAAELGLTVYETAVMLRAPMPVVVLRTEDRAKALQVLGALRSRRHEAVAFDYAAVAASETMFTPKTFRFEGGELVGMGHGEEHRLPFTSMFALVRATHLTHVEETITNRQVKLSLGRAAMTGGLMATKVTTSESKRINDEREAVLYVFRTDAAPWLLRSTHIRYDGLGAELRVSTVENFEVLVRALRQLAHGHRTTRASSPCARRLARSRATARSS